MLGVVDMLMKWNLWCPVFCWVHQGGKFNTVFALKWPTSLQCMVLQSVLNIVAQLIYQLRLHDHIIPHHRCTGNIALAAHPRTCAPRYLGPIVAVADLPSGRALRSATTSRRVMLPIKLSTAGSRVFPCLATAQVWNGLSDAVVSSSSLQTFCHQLKTHLFQLSYPYLIFWLLDWHRYIGPCSNVCYSKNLCLPVYLLTSV